MDIFLNDEKIDVSIQNEKFLGELVLGLKEWLKENSLLFLGLEVNGSQIDFEADTEWENQALEGIQTLHLWANHPLLIERDQLNLLLEYLVLLGASLEEIGETSGARGVDQFHEILHELPGILAALERFFPGNSGTPQELLSGISTDRQTLLESWSTYRSSCTTLEILLQSRIREYNSPQQEAVSTLKTIANLQEPLSQVSVRLQGGKVDQALITIQQLVELLQKLARTMGLLRNHPAYGGLEGERIQSTGETLNSLLEDLVQGMENNDVVLIGDILEYELPPVFQELQILLEGQ